MGKTKDSAMQNPPGMLTCQEVDRFIDDYLSERLTKVQQGKFKFHIRLCPDCKQYLEKYRRSIELAVATFHDEDRCAELPEELVEAISAAKYSDVG